MAEEGSGGGGRTEGVRGEPGDRIDGGEEKSQGEDYKKKDRGMTDGKDQ